MTDSPLTPEALATWTDEAIIDAWKRSSWEVGELVNTDLDLTAEPELAPDRRSDALKLPA